MPIPLELEAREWGLTLNPTWIYVSIYQALCGFACWGALMFVVDVASSSLIFFVGVQLSVQVIRPILLLVFLLIASLVFLLVHDGIASE
jgi:hypothetical protein